MALKILLQELGAVEKTPCVTISLNTHRTHPDNAKDEIVLKNLLNEAEERVLNEFDKRDVGALLNKIKSVQSEIDVNYNLDSLHIFLSNSIQEIVRLPLSINQNTVQVDDSFAIRALIKAYSRSQSYLVMLLSQGGVKLYETVNDGIVMEIKNDDFPFPESDYEVLYPERRSDSEYMDDLVRGYFNKVDKAFLNIFNETDLRCVVVCTTDNYSRLLQVANKPNAYLGHVNIDYNKVSPHHLAQQSWEVVKSLQKQSDAAAIEEVQEAVSSGKVLTDLQEIYQAAIDGRGDLLIVDQDYTQPVMMTGDRTFDLVEDSTTVGANDDIISNIAWEILSKKGRIISTTTEKISSLGRIVLKARY